MAALDAVGLTDRAEHHPNQLSGGQQQRVAIARALVNEPSVLLADEPTGNLDTQTSHEVMEIFGTLRRERGLTIVVITHERDIAAYGTRTIDFRDGQVVADRLNADEHTSCSIQSLTSRSRRFGAIALQTLLTMIGISMGVATVLAMMAVGAGAQRAVEQQVRAAGLNQLTIRAGNWRPKQEENGEAIAHQGDARDSLTLPVPELVSPATGGTDIARRRRFTPKTTRWRSTIIRSRASGWATSKRALARRRR